MKPLSKTESRAAHPSVHRRRSRRLNAAAIRGPRRKYFRWGKDVRPRKTDETLSRHGRRARRVAFLSPSGSPPKVFSVGQSERRSVYSVRRSIISMRYLNFIKKDEKSIPHFRRIALFPSGGGKPEGKEGEQHSPRDVHSIPRLSPMKPTGRGQSILQCQRIALYTEEKEGEQHSLRDAHSISPPSTPPPPRRRFASVPLRDIKKPLRERLLRLCGVIITRSPSG